MDAHTREYLALEADTSFASQRVTRVLHGVMADRERPQSIRMDNELNARYLFSVKAHFIRNNGRGLPWVAEQLS